MAIKSITFHTNARNQLIDLTLMEQIKCILIKAKETIQIWAKSY